jgi:hypothetical protein
VAPDDFSSVWNAAQPLPLRASRCARWMSHFSCGERGNVDSMAAMSPATPSEMISSRGRIPRFVSPSRQSAPRDARQPAMTLPAGWTDLVAQHPRRIPSGSACHKDASITARGAQMRELRPACPGLRGDEVAGTGSSSRTRPATRLHEELLIKASAAGACILRQRTRSPTAGSPQARWPGAVSRRGRPSSIRDGRDRGFGASARPWRFPMTPITHMRAAKRVKLGLVTRTERGL